MAQMNVTAMLIVKSKLGIGKDVDSEGDAFFRNHLIHDEVFHAMFSTL